MGHHVWKRNHTKMKGHSIFREGMAVKDADHHPNEVNKEKQSGFSESWTGSHDFWEEVKDAVCSVGVRDMKADN